ncbi:MAG: hypothetical protein FWG49_07965 [Leptospirales bacterium]|nr:hypothetical protein [Leptospirales bacterium]
MMNKLIDKSGKKTFICYIIFTFMLIFSACGGGEGGSESNDPIPAELIGTWKQTIMGGYESFTFDTDLVRYYSNSSSHNPTESSYELTKSLIFKKLDNTNAATQVEYPSGYYIEGEVTSATGAYSMTLGDFYINRVFLNSEKNKFSRQGSSSSIFVKEP